MKNIYDSKKFYIYKTETIGYYVLDVTPDRGIENFKNIRPLLDSIYKMPDHIRKSKCII